LLIVTTHYPVSNEKYFISVQSSSDGGTSWRTADEGLPPQREGLPGRSDALQIVGLIEGTLIAWLPRHGLYEAAISAP
jgi:hypothetical protein